MLKLSIDGGMTSNVKVVLYWGRGLKMSFEPLSNYVLEDSNLLFIMVHPDTVICCKWTPLFLGKGSLSLGATRRLPMVEPLSKCSLEDSSNIFFMHS